MKTNVPPPAGARPCLRPTKPATDQARLSTPIMAALLGALLWAILAHAQPRKAAEASARARVAVGRFKVPDNLAKDVTADTLTDLLREAGTDGLRHKAVVSTPELRKVADWYRSKAALPSAADLKLAEADFAKTMGGTRFLLLPTVSKLGDEWVMTATVVDLTSGKARTLKATAAGGDAKQLHGLIADLWRQLDAPSLKTTLKHDDRVFSVGWSPDGKLLATGTGVNVWDANGTLKRTLPQSRVYSVVWSPDGKLLATGSEEGTAKVWGADGSLKHTFKYDIDALVYSVAWSPDGKLLATASTDGTIKITTVADGKLKHTFKHHNVIKHINSVAWSPGGELATGGNDGTAKVWRSNGTLMSTLKHDSWVYSVAWSPDG